MGPWRSGCDFYRKQNVVTALGIEPNNNNNRFCKLQGPIDHYPCVFPLLVVKKTENCCLILHFNIMLRRALAQPRRNGVPIQRIRGQSMVSRFRRRSQSTGLHTGTTFTTLVRWAPTNANDGVNWTATLRHDQAENFYTKPHQLLTVSLHNKEHLISDKDGYGNFQDSTWLHSWSKYGTLGGKSAPPKKA